MANDLNRVTLIGRLTRDAELKYTNSGLAVCKLGLAVNYRKRSGDQWADEVSFFDVTIFGRQGESINQYLQKGKQIAVDGELRQDRWEQDGQPRSKVTIIANNVQLLGGAGGGGGGGGGSYSGGNNSYGGQRQGNQSGQGGRGSYEPYGGSGSSSDFEDDIPF